MHAPDYDTGIRVAQYLVAGWLLCWLIHSLRGIARGDARTILFVQLVYFFFIGLPLLLDILVASPRYEYQWGFVVSQYDFGTNAVYLGYIALCPAVFHVLGGSRSRLPAALPGGNSPTLTGAMGRWPRIFSWVALLTVPAALAMAPEPSIYLEYAAMTGGRYRDAEKYHSLITACSNLAVIAGVLIFTARNSSLGERVAAMPIVLLALWLNGKRGVVAIAIFLLLYLLWMRGSLRGRRFLAAASVASVLLAGFSYTYQSRVRDIEIQSIEDRSLGESDVYVNFRIDYGRDAIIKQAIFAELNPQRMRILDYRGQSLVFDLTFMIPRSWWAEKPYPYAVYATAAMLHGPVEMIGWGTTTSWLEEAIANLGWLGLLIGPILPAMVCALGDRRRTPLRSLLTLAVATLLLVVHLVAFMSLFLLWLAIVMRDRLVTRAAARVTSQSGD